MLLQPAKQENAFLKVGILGFAGSGKTYTATHLALGLIKHLKSKKPFAIVETEPGTDWLLPLCKEQGVVVWRKKTRAFQELLAIIREAEKNCDVLLIDSISHFWKHFLESYMKRLGRTRLLFQDWNVIKPKWGEFTDLFLNSKVHIILCGRAGYEYDYFEDESGKKELIKTGTKMKAETEMSYESSLLLEMERAKPKDGTVGQKWIHRCHVLKDRSDQIDGETFDNPTFHCFLPHIEALNLGGEHIGVDTTHTSEEVFDKEGKTEEWRLEKRRKVLLEEIEAELVCLHPSTGGIDKKAKLEIIEDVFKTKAWTQVAMLPISILEQGLADIRSNVEKDSAYA